MRITLARCTVVTFAVLVFAGCSNSGGVGYSPNWSWSKLNPFSSSKELATAEPFSRPSELASPTSTRPTSAGYASAASNPGSTGGSYPGMTASYNSTSTYPVASASGGNSSGYSKTPPYPSAQPSSSTAYGATTATASSSSPRVTPQQGFYDPGASYNPLGKPGTSAPSYSSSALSSTSPTTPPMNSYGLSRDSSYRSASRNYSAASGYPAYGSKSAAGTTTGSRLGASPYGAAADRYGSAGTASSSYDRTSSSHAGSGSRSDTSSSSASTGGKYPLSGTRSGATAATTGTRYGTRSTAQVGSSPYAAPYKSTQAVSPTSGAGSLVGKRYAAAYDANRSASAGDYRATSAARGTASRSPGRTGYNPGRTGYDPGNTGYHPPNVPPYQSPAGKYSVPGATSGSDSIYSPGSIDRYRSSGTTTPYPSAGASPTSYRSPAGTNPAPPSGYL